MINSSILSIIVCFIPTIIIGLILYYFDSDKSKKKILMLTLSFIFGAFMFYIAYRLDMHFGSYFKGYIAASYFKSFLYALFHLRYPIHKNRTQTSLDLLKYHMY